MDIKLIISAIAVTFMCGAYCELPPVPQGMIVYDGEREGVSYEDLVAAGKAPKPTDYDAADEVLLQMNPDAFTSDDHKHFARRRNELAQKPPVKFVRVKR